MASKREPRAKTYGIVEVDGFVRGCMPTRNLALMYCKPGERIALLLEAPPSTERELRAKEKVFRAALRLEAWLNPDAKLLPGPASLQGLHDGLRLAVAAWRKTKGGKKK